jgi:hypothetical protein
MYIVKGTSLKYVWWVESIIKLRSFVNRKMPGVLLTQSRFRKLTIPFLNTRASVVHPTQPPLGKWRCGGVKRSRRGCAKITAMRETAQENNITTIDDIRDTFSFFCADACRSGKGEDFLFFYDLV